MKTAWVLRLKEESKESDMVGDYYFVDGSESEWLTDNLQDAEVFYDKEKSIQEMKLHEEIMIDQYGKNAIVNYGYTNLMKHFEFVEVEVEDGESHD